MTEEHDSAGSLTELERRSQTLTAALRRYGAEAVLNSLSTKLLQLAVLDAESTFDADAINSEVAKAFTDQTSADEHEYARAQVEARLADLIQRLPPEAADCAFLANHTDMMALFESHYLLSDPKFLMLAYVALNAGTDVAHGAETDVALDDFRLFSALLWATKENPLSDIVWAVSMKLHELKVPSAPSEYQMTAYLLGLALTRNCLAQNDAPLSVRRLQTIFWAGIKDLVTLLPQNERSLEFLTSRTEVLRLIGERAQSHDWRKSLSQIPKEPDDLSSGPGIGFFPTHKDNKQYRKIVRADIVQRVVEASNRLPPMTARDLSHYRKVDQQDWGQYDYIRTSDDERFPIFRVEGSLIGCIAGLAYARLSHILGLRCLQLGLGVNLHQSGIRLQHPVSEYDLHAVVSPYSPEWLTLEEWLEQPTDDRAAIINPEEAAAHKALSALTDPVLAEAHRLQPSWRYNNDVSADPSGYVLPDGTFLKVPSMRGLGELQIGFTLSGAEDKYFEALSLSPGDPPVPADWAEFRDQVDVSGLPPTFFERLASLTVDELASVIRFPKFARRERVQAILAERLLFVLETALSFANK